MHARLVCFIFVLLCQACSQQFTREAPLPADPESRAQEMIVTGNYLAAADEYERLAALYPQQAVFYQLRVVHSLLRAGDVSRAREILERLDTNNKSDLFYRQILRAQLALADRQPREALAFLGSPPAGETTEEFNNLWHLTRSEAFELSQNFFQAAEERVQLHAYLVDAEERRTNARYIWDDLNHLKPAALRELRNSGNASMNAWIELSIINQTMLFKPGLLEQAVNSWREKYPQHAANPTIVEDILGLSKKAILQPRHIAILLPLSGQYEGASHAIRDGFLAAWYQEQGLRPMISVYDANALNIDGAYRQALADGADFVVGPLEKQAIDRLLQNAGLDVTTLALNQADRAGLEQNRDTFRQLPGLIQFGLSPEGEARQVAERAIYDGHNKALVIAPNNDWGKRLAEAFINTWNSLGGKVLEYVSYDQLSQDYSTPVKKLLNIDSSQLRVNRLRQKLNRSLQTEPRLRQDADMVFMAAVPLSARQIVPQFRFHLASGIPVYSTSHSYSGNVNTEADSDMNGIMIADMPAVLENEQQSSAVLESVNRHWSASTSNYRRLYALGIDSYRLIPHLGKLYLQDTATYHGETGDLYMTRDGRVQRKLLWARFIDGRPSLLEPGPVY